MILDDLIKLPILQKPGTAAAQEAGAGYQHGNRNNKAAHG